MRCTWPRTPGSIGSGVKFLNQKFSKDADKLNRFVQEAKVASALNNPNILTVYEIGETEGTNYIVTELIEGRTLREHLAQKGSYSPKALLLQLLGPSQLHYSGALADATTSQVMTVEY